MTESNSIAVALAGIDYEERPTAAWVTWHPFYCRNADLANSGLPCPVNDMLIVKDDREAPRGMSGEVWLYVSLYHSATIS